MTTDGTLSVLQQLEALHNRLLIESKIKDGAENLLSVFQLGAEKEGLRSQIMAELAAANREIENLERRIAELQKSVNGETCFRTLFQLVLTQGCSTGRPAPQSDVDDSYSDGTLNRSYGRLHLLTTLASLCRR